jgi:hypothetical protein
MKLKAASHRLLRGCATFAVERTMGIRMETQRWHQMIIRHAFVGMLVLLATGCGGGGGSTPGGGALALTCEPAVTDEVVHADAGNIVAVRVNESATLNGCASSTTLTAPLTYSWAFSSMPEGSTAQLQGATSVSPSFIADVPGTYAVQLVVSADGINSRRAIAAVEVSVDGFYTGYRVHTSYPSQCSECHDGRFALGAGPVDPVPTKIGAHPPTSNMCQACHTTFGFNLLRQVDHLEVFGNCSSCHDGGIAIGKSQFHVATTAECDNCHDTTSFLTVGADGSFDHTGITGGCERCHNGTVAIGKYDGHFVTTKDCGSCHNTVSFKDAFVDHSNITQDCASCHDGVMATGQTVGHPVGTAITTTIVLARAASHLRSITCQRLLTVVYAMVSVEVISPMVSLITPRLLTLTIAQNVMEIAEMGQDRSSRLTICRPPKTVVFVTHRVALPRAFMIMPGLLVAARLATTV